MSGEAGVIVGSVDGGRAVGLQTSLRKLSKRIGHLGSTFEEHVL